MKIERSALVVHSAMEMYQLVQDVPVYPQFLSWCTASRVFEQTHDMQRAELEVLVAGVRQQFSTLNTLVVGERVGMRLLEGPFRALQGEWCFTQLGTDGSKVSLELEFEMTKGVVSRMFGKGFGHVADRLVGDFCKRADDVFG